MSTTSVKKSTGKKAARTYSARTLKLLWGRGAGHCSMPECRVELFADATDYDPIVVIGEIAHVIASADEGPRGDASLTAAERDSYDNLILLCQNCHQRIDGQAGSFTVERLKDIKQAHEAWVRASLPERGRSTTGWKVVALEGDHPLDLATVPAALAPDFAAGEPRKLQVPGNTDDWGAVDREIKTVVDDVLKAGDSFEHRLAIFAIAPVSACIALGYRLTSRPHVRVFQNDRDSKSWQWPRMAAPAEDLTVHGLERGDAGVQDLVFAFHLSAEITDEALQGALPAGAARIDFRVPSPSTSWLRHPEQVTFAALSARSVFETALGKFPRTATWHVYFAGPAPVAITVGQQINPTIFPPVQLYEYRRNLAPRYQPSIRLA